MRLSLLRLLVLGVFALFLSACFYGSEFIEGDDLRRGAERCGVKDFRITHEDDVDYLDLPAGAEDPDTVAHCIESAAKGGSMALVRVAEEVS